MIMKIKVPEQYSNRKHSVCEYEMETETGIRNVLLDLTILRKSRMYDSVPLYRIENNRAVLCGIRSVKYLHEHDSIY